MSRVVFLTIISLSAFGVIQAYPQSQSEDYAEVLTYLKSFDWDGPAIPRFLNPSRVQKNQFDDPPTDVKTFKINQTLDHFDSSNKKIFEWLYHENNNYYKPGGPILIWVGGEWAAWGPEISAGTFYAHLAERFNATLFYTEHRYYGESQPFSDHSTENLAYLDIEQGMEDLAYFIKYIKEKRPELKNAKVVLIGGSYTGTLVSWLRMKYPDLTVGAWSSSGVLDLRADFQIYKVLAGENYRKAGGDKCYNAINSTFEQLEKWADEKRGDLIEENFKLCKPLNYENTLDVQSFFNILGLMLAGITQVLREPQTVSICNNILNETAHETPMQGIAAFVHSLVPCIPGRFEHTEKFLNNTEMKGVEGSPLRQWFYQCCTGFGFFYTTTSRQQPFGTKVPLEFWSALCSAVYKKEFTVQTLVDAADELREKYGGVEKANFTKVYTSQGDLDPVKGAGAVKDVGPTSPTYVIEGAAHTFDLTTGYQDIPGVVVSQEKVIKEMERWLKGSGVSNKPFIFMVLGSIIFLLLKKM